MKKVLITGGSGLVGQKLMTILREENCEVGILSRSPRNQEGVKYHHWDLETMIIDESALEYDYVVNLAGAGIADKRWTSKRKKEIIESREKSAELLLQYFQKRKKIKAIINASAIGYYGDSGGALLSEDMTTTKSDFLAAVCRKWEEAAFSLQNITDRLIILRIGTVLSGEGGALPKMALPIKYGMANYLGNGQQWMSWIHINDLCRMIMYFIQNENTQGIYNGVSPNPSKNKYFTKQLRKAVNPFSILLPAPSFAIKLALGELSTLVLNSNRVSAQKVLESGFVFRYSELERALVDVFG